MQNAFQVCQHFVVPESDDSIAVFLDRRGSNRILFRSFGMLAAVEFDHQPFLSAAEIHDVAINRNLAAEFEIFKSARTELTPQLRFRVRRISAQLP